MAFGMIAVQGQCISRVVGFGSAFVSELFSVNVGSSSATGLVVSINANPAQQCFVGGLLLTDEALGRISLGAQVTSKQRMLSVLVGDYCLGSLLDPLGNLIALGSTWTGRSVDFRSTNRWLIEPLAPSIRSRQSVYEPLQTGITAVDCMIPVGRGQRELIVGDRSSGKTTLAVDTILNQKLELLG